MAFRLDCTYAETTIAECLAKGWAVFLECGTCARLTPWRETELRRRPMAERLDAIAARATCSGCGGRKGRLYTRQGGWVSADRARAFDAR